MSYGGIAAVHRLVTKLGLVNAIDTTLKLLKVHLPYHESDHACLCVARLPARSAQAGRQVLNLAYNVMCGGTRLEDIERLRPSTPEASGISLPTSPLRLLPTEATFVGWDSHPLKIRAFSRRTKDSRGNRPGNTETEVAVPVVGGAPDAVRGAEVPGYVAPRAAAQHATRAIAAFPRRPVALNDPTGAVFLPSHRLPQALQLAQLRPNGIPPAILCRRPRTRGVLPLRLARQPVALARLRRQPLRIGHRILPRHVDHRTPATTPAFVVRPLATRRR